MKIIRWFTDGDFFWERHSNGIYGPGGYVWKKFKTGNLALVIAIISLVLIIGFILFTIFM